MSVTPLLIDAKVAHDLLLKILNDLWLFSFGIPRAIHLRVSPTYSVWMRRNHHLEPAIWKNQIPASNGWRCLQNNFWNYLCTHLFWCKSNAFWSCQGGSSRTHHGCSLRSSKNGALPLDFGMSDVLFLQLGVFLKNTPHFDWLNIAACTFCSSIWRCQGDSKNKRLAASK